MDKQYLNIFRKLREYFMLPGINLWGRVRKRLFSSDLPDDQKLSLKDFEIQPPEKLFGELMDTIQQSLIKARFENLKDHAVAAPGENFEKITGLIEDRKKKSIIAKMPAFQKWIAAASVIAVIAALLWMNSKDEKPGEVLVKDGQPFTAPAKKTDTVTADTLLINKDRYSEKGDVLVNAAPIKPTRQKIELSKIVVDGIEIPVENNEILYSLIKYTNGSQVNWKKAGKIVRLNDYAGIEISPYISKVIAELYGTKKNGKKTTKARKAAAKIKKWQKADMRSFDRKKNKTKNPLDIVDLAENVY